MTIDQLLSRLDKVKANSNDPNKWLARCPAHNDRSPSLGIKQTGEGKILIHCFSGCAVTDIVGAIGLTLADLMPNDPTHKKGVKPPRFNRFELFNILYFESIILRLAIRELLNKTELSSADLERITKAESIIDDIVREVGQ